jgi:predicted nucleotidyltransferase
VARVAKLTVIAKFIRTQPRVTGKEDRMAAISIKQQQYGELIAPETIDEVAKAIAENFHPEKIILFGSYASGIPTPDSDLDFLVVMDSEQPRYRRAIPMHLMFSPKPCPMDILVYTPDEIVKWNGTISHVVTEAFQHGRVLYER